MWLAEFYYKKIKKTSVPYYAKYSLVKILSKPSSGEPLSHE